MKKFIFGVVIIAVLGLVAMPFISGILTEDMVNKLVTNANQYYQDAQTDMKVEIVSYERNIGNSTIEWRLNLGEYGVFYGTDTIIFVEHLKHGYTGVTSETSLEKNPWYTTLLKKYNIEKNPLHITTKYTLFGDITSQLQLDSFMVTVDKAPLTIKPANLTVSCDTTFKHFTSEGQWDGFFIDKKVSAGKATITSDTTLHSPFLVSGTAQFIFEGITAQEKNETAQIQGIKGSSLADFNAKENSITVKVDCSIEKVIIPEKTIKDITGSLVLSGLDATAYEEAIQSYMNFISNLMEGIKDDAPQATEEYLSKNMAELSAQMVNMYEKICKSGLELSLNDIKATFPEGKILGNAKITLLQDLSMGAFMLIAATPSEALNYIALKTQLQFPKALSDNTAGLTSPIYPGMQTGLFVEDGSNLKHNAETRNKKLFINGEEIQL